MKISNIIIGTLMSVALAAGLTSCSSDDYEMVGQPSGAQVYFPSDKSSSEICYIEDNQSSVNIPISRIVANSDLTVNVTSTDPSGLFTIPASATFKAEEKTAYLNVTFDFASIEANKGYLLTFKIEDETTIYGPDSTSIIIKYEPWTEWEPLEWKYPEGISSYAEWEKAYDEYVAGEFANPGLICDGTLPIYGYKALAGWGFEGTYYQPVHYRESMIDKNQAQLLLTGWFMDCDLVINWDRATDIFTCSPQNTGSQHPSSGESVYVTDSYNYWHNIKGQTVSIDDLPQGYDAANGKLTLNFAYYISQGCMGYGEETIQLPGYKADGDYRVEIEDEGSYSNDNKYGQIFFFTLSDDVAKVKYAAVDSHLSANDASQYAVAINNGELVSTETTESGHKVQMVTKEGKYTLVVCAYNADDEYVGYTTQQFTVKAAASYTWTAINTGNYIYTLYFASGGEETVDEDLTLYVCDQDPTRFKISPWAYTDNFTFHMDADGKIVVDDQVTGFVDPVYGDLFVGDLSNYPDFGSDTSYYEDGMYYFSLIYYVTEGPLQDGIGYEGFEVTGSAKAASERAKSVARAIETANRTLPTPPIVVDGKFPTKSRFNHINRVKYNNGTFVTFLQP